MPRPDTSDIIKFILHLDASEAPASSTEGGAASLQQPQLQASMFFQPDNSGAADERSSRGALEASAAALTPQGGGVALKQLKFMSDREDEVESQSGTIVAHEQL